MDQIFDRLGRLFRSWSTNESGERVSTDPDQREAEEELEEFLRTGKERPQRPHQQGQKSYQHNHASPPPQDLEIRKALAVLELGPNATWEEINNAHKRLLMNAHPDRHAGNIEAQREATVVSQKINEAYQKLKKHFGR